MSKNNRRSFYWRITSAHTITYFIAGLFAVTFMNYSETFNTGDLGFMRPTDSPWVAAGPGLQVIRGFFLGLILFPFLPVFQESKMGWLKFWILTVGLSALFTFSAAIGSFEGIIYTNVSFKTHLNGLPELLLYNTLFTFLLWFWYRKPLKIFNIISIILVAIILLMSFLGVLLALGMIPEI